ncbi:MAG: hypothetical protein ABIC57_03290 [bacterium]
MKEEYIHQFVNAFRVARIEVLFQDIPSTITTFDLSNGNEYKPLVEYLSLIGNEINNRLEGVEERELINEIPAKFCSEELFPRWIGAFKQNGISVLGALRDSNLLEIVKKQLSVSLDCENDIETILRNLVQDSILYGVNLQEHDSINVDIENEGGGEIDI